MAEKPTFSSWEPTWSHYGPLVYQTARALDPSLDDAAWSSGVADSAAAGFLDTKTFDPLAALLVELLRNRSQADRRIAAESLIRCGIDVERAASATETIQLISVHAADSLTPISTDTRPALIPTFEDIRSRALALWEERVPQRKAVQVGTDTNSASTTQTDQELESAVAGYEPSIPDEEQENPKQDLLELAQTRRRTRRRNSVVWSLVVFIVGATAGQVFVPRLFTKQRELTSLPLLAVRDLPKQWKLTFATSHLPADLLLPTTVFQRFDSADKERSVLVTTRLEGRGSDDLSFAMEIHPEYLASNHMVLQAQAKALDSFPIKSPPKRPVMMEWKQPTNPLLTNQPMTLVYLQALGLPRNEVEVFGRNLTARPNLLQKGWATPNGYTEQIAPPKRSVKFGIQSSLTFTSTLDGQTRVVVNLRPAEKAAIEANDLYDPLPQTTLPSGRIVTFNKEFDHNYWWTESGYRFEATVLRSNDRDGSRQGATQQSEGFYSTLEALPQRHPEGVLDLLDRFQLGNDEQWLALTAGYQSSLHSLPSLGTVQIGGLNILTRTLPKTGRESPTTLRLPYALCAYSVCAPIYYNGLAREADLLIDDHWWHFRQIPNYDKTVPTYFTRPPVDSFKTGEAAFDRIYRWWGIDFGTEITAARTANSEILLRPLPR